MKTVLFLCTGNYYRSRFAEVFFNWHAEQRGLPWRAQSRGLALFADNVNAMSNSTLERLLHHAIPHEQYQRLPLDAAPQDFESADLVVAVKETEHRPLIERRFPDWLTAVEFWEVHDIDVASPEVAMPHLERHVLGLLEKLTEVPPGRYRHFKGNEYTVLGTSRHSETLEEFVVYQAEYGDRGLWIRPKGMFLETVEFNGRVVPRFQRLGTV